MFINISLSIIFVVSMVILWYKISELIPRLNTISDEAINTLLKEESAKIRVFFLEIKSFVREERHKDVLNKMIHKNLHRVHVLVLKLDNKIVALLKDIRSEQNAVIPKISEDVVEIIKVPELETLKDEVNVIVEKPSQIVEIKHIQINDNPVISDIKIQKKSVHKLAIVQEIKKRRGRPAGSKKKNK